MAYDILQLYISILKQVLCYFNFLFEIYHYLSFLLYSIGYIDAMVAVKAIDSSIADRGIGWKVLYTIFIITGQ
jgi:hypothetical protein